VIFARSKSPHVRFGSKADNAATKNQAWHKKKQTFTEGFFERVGQLSRAPINFGGEPMITEIASVVGGCVFAGLTMICVAQFFRSKYPPS
jgi:hypothetical protein